MGTNYVTQINLMRVEPTQQHELIGLRGWDQVERALFGQPGFVSAAVHRSFDGSRAVTYIQWADGPSLAVAMNVARVYRAASGRVRPLLLDDGPRLYEVVYTNDKSGATAIQVGTDVATFINVISTAPENQERLCQFVTGNDEKAFSTQPGFRSANFHKSRDGERVVNYSHWESEASFLAAISKMLGMPGLDMETANQIATKGAKGMGSTDFRFYEVVSSDS